MLPLWHLGSRSLISQEVSREAVTFYRSPVIGENLRQLIKPVKEARFERFEFSDGISKVSVSRAEVRYFDP